ncbi:MAG: hypothetical protein V1911_02215 [Candidatus Micrarchaeota archaeon]
MEGLPFRLMLSIILTGAILAASFYVLASYAGFSTEKAFADDALKVKDAVRELRSTSDIGSFSRVNVKVPGQSNITFNNATDAIDFKIPGKNYSVGIEGHFLWNRTYGPGSYEFEIYYGTPLKAPDEDPYLVPFV